MKYTNNEAYFDVIEEIDAIIDKSGSTVFAEIQGYVSFFKFFEFILFSKSGSMEPLFHRLPAHLLGTASTFITVIRIPVFSLQETP